MVFPVTVKVLAAEAQAGHGGGGDYVRVLTKICMVAGVLCVFGSCWYSECFRG